MRTLSPVAGDSAAQCLTPPQVGYLSPKEAALFLSVSVKELERLRYAGGGPRYVKLGKRTVRYAIPELHAWMQSRTVSNTAEAAAQKGAGRE